MVGELSPCSERTRQYFVPVVRLGIVHCDSGIPRTHHSTPVHSAALAWAKLGSEPICSSYDCGLASSAQSSVAGRVSAVPFGGPVSNGAGGIGALKVIVTLRTFDGRLRAPFPRPRAPGTRGRP